ncbi:Interleukin-6 [Tupaia chinensis]|uniref:Interleukin-6 n=1 Tax=Tupaia chinensis TaxID=246437 RepID=L9KY14_TUPCH|nr:Interleukin-6 [Tupaia chinensis]
MLQLTESKILHLPTRKPAMTSLSTRKGALSLAVFFLGLSLMMATADPTIPAPSNTEEIIYKMFYHINLMKNEETCLRRINNGLQEFQVYLEFLEKNLNDTDNVRSVQIYSRALMRTLMSPTTVTSPSPDANASLLEKMQAQDKSMRTETARLILCRLDKFLQYAMRASRIK